MANNVKSLLDIEIRYNNYLEENLGGESKQEFYRRHILNESNKRVTAKFINGVFRKYGLKHKVQNLALFQRAFVHESYLECNIMNKKYLRQIKDTPSIPKKHVKKSLPLLDHTPIVNKNKKIEYIANMDYDKKIHKKATGKDIKKLPSMHKEHLSYELLEFLGDAVIHDAIASYLYHRYPEQNEGFVTRIRTNLENGKTQSKFSKCMGLHKYMIISRCMERAGARLNNYKVAEDILEAFIGALSKEISREECFKFIIKIIEAEADIVAMISTVTNYKGELMKEYHKHPTWDAVKYIDITEEVKENMQIDDKLFYMKATTGEESQWYEGRGKGKSKQDAEKMAAKDILIQMGIIGHTLIDDNDDKDDIYDEGSDSDSDDDIYSCSDSESS